MTSHDALRPGAGRQEWTGLVVLLLPLLLVSMDVSVLYFAVPFIGRDLQPTSTQQLWIFDVYGFVLAGLLITMGSLGDRIGRRRLLLIGAAAFSAASFGAAYSHTAAELIAARAVQGVAGATLMPSTLALIRNMFHDERQRRTAIAVWTSTTTGGVALGPVLSGVLLNHFWWGSVFLINIPFMLMLLVLAPTLVPEFRVERRGRFDIASSMLSLGAVLPAIYGIKEMAANGVTWPRVACVAIGAVAGAVFVVRQRRGAHPMIDVAMFRSRGFTGAVAVNLLAMFAIVGFAVFTTQYLQSVLGMSPLRAALWSVVPTIGIGGVAPLTAALVRRVDRATVAGAGFVVSATGFAVLTRLRPDSHLWFLLVAATLYAGGLVMVMTIGGELAMGAVPPERAGAASAVVETATEFGGALGMAVLGSIGAAIYRGHLAALMAGQPIGLSEHEQGAARDTLGGALAVAGHLPPRTGAALLAAARESFVRGMDVTALTVTVIMVAAAMLTRISLRGIPIDVHIGEGHIEEADASDVQDARTVSYDGQVAVSPPATHG